MILNQIASGSGGEGASIQVMLRPFLSISYLATPPMQEVLS